MGENRTNAVSGMDVEVSTCGRTLRGLLAVPVNARGVVVFAHGSGSGRLSPRNRAVAEVLQKAGLGTLLVDLLDEQEASDRELVFDVELLSRRLNGVSQWLAGQPATERLAIGYFGASTGAAAALLAAAREPSGVGAVVSRGGRPDLALDWLAQVVAPTLLIVGGADEIVLDLNRDAYALLRCPRRLEVIAGATHLFPEPGALDEVARLAKEWFLHHLCEHLP